MGKTGGGRGTNQYQIKGRSAQRHQARERIPAVLRRTTYLDHDAVEHYLGKLVDRLVAAGAEARILLVGGAALSYYYDRPLTVDVDAAVYPAGLVLAEAQALGDDERLPRGWLNNAAVGFLPHEEISEKVAIERKGVRVEVAAPGALLAMKLRACRPQKDFSDIAWLLRHCDVRSVEEAEAWLDRYFPEEELSVRDKELVRAALGPVMLRSVPARALEAVRPRSSPTECQRWVLREDGHCALPPGHKGPCSTGRPTRR